VSGKSKLLGVCDISADYEGSIQFTESFTTIEEPFGVYDPITATHYDKISLSTEHCILFNSIDHLPAEMPKEASMHFGDKLKPFLKDIVYSNPHLDYE
jgi:alpha-aminoadipic semialdehyde synthase